MFLDITQVILFVMAMAFQFGWFGLNEFFSTNVSFITVPILLMNITISWLVALISDRQSRGSWVTAFLEYAAFSVALLLHWYLLEGQSFFGFEIPKIALIAIVFALVAWVVIVNVGQELFSISLRAARHVPRKATRVSYGPSGGKTPK